MPEQQYEYTVRITVMGGQFLHGRVVHNKVEADQEFRMICNDGSLAPGERVVLLRRPVGAWEKQFEFIRPTDRPDGDEKGGA